MSADQVVGWLSGLSLETWLAIASALAAGLSFLMNRQIVRRQMEMQAASLKAQMDAEVMAWGAETVEALTRAAWLADNRGLGLDGQDFQRARSEALAQISSLVDKGRLHFPNDPGTGHEEVRKSRAFRGGRPFVLNPLVFAYYELERMSHLAPDPDADASRFFVMCRREFVSELQNHLDPRRRAEQMRMLGLAGKETREESYADSLALALDLEGRYPGLLAAKGDQGWARNVERAQSGDAAMPNFARTR